jgi:ABC-type branched-subunit amino acid transport system substrate-binding protein
VVTAAATVSLTGPSALQGGQAAAGLRWWAAQAGNIDLEIIDDTGSASVAAVAYQRWVDGGVDILIGPYGSNLVRAVIPVVTDAQRMMWNHGGSADDLAHRLVVSIPGPASTYFQGAVEIAAKSGVEEILLVAGRGRFAAAVAIGARTAATRAGLKFREMQLKETSEIVARAAGAAVLIVGTFDQDVSIVRELHHVDSGFVACVAAGLPQFAERVGSAAEGVLGPVPWIPKAATPQIGPSGTEYTRHYQAIFDSQPSYVAAQATAAGLLAEEAHRLELRSDDVLHWQTSTLLGDFTVDDSWCQVGHKAHTIRWQHGQQVPLL